MRLNYIELWPRSGHVDQMWTDDPATDALARTAVRVCEAYSAALEAEEFDGRHSSLRFFAHPHDGDHVVLQVDVRDPMEWEAGVITVPAAVADLSPQERAHLMVEVVDETLLALAPHRGWSIAAIERTRERVLAGDLEFRWDSAWKASPDRSMAARLMFVIADDGFGRVAIEVRNRRADAVIARSTPVLTPAGLVNFRRTAKTLQWSHRALRFRPRSDSFSDDVVVFSPDQGDSHEPTAASASTPPSGVVIPPITQVPWGHQVNDATPGLDVHLGFGVGLSASMLADRMNGDLGEQIAAQLFEHIATEPIRRYLDGVPVEIWLEYDLPNAGGPAVESVRLRKTRSRLDVTMTRDGYWLLDGGEAAAGRADLEASQVVGQVMTALEARVRRR